MKITFIGNFTSVCFMPTECQTTQTLERGGEDKRNRPLASWNLQSREEAVLTVPCQDVGPKPSVLHIARKEPWLYVSARGAFSSTQTADTDRNKYATWVPQDINLKQGD